MTLRSLWLLTWTIQWSRKWLPKQQLAWSERWLSLHAREHSTDLFILFYSCPGHNHPGLAVCVLLNKCHIIDEFYNFALEAQGILGLHFDLGGIWAFSRPMPFVLHMLKAWALCDLLMAPTSLPVNRFYKRNKFYVWSKSRISVIITVAVDMIETMNCHARVFHVGGRRNIYDNFNICTEI